MRHVFIVRHGNTFEAGEPPRRIGLRSDLPLTAQGCAQVSAVGQHFDLCGIRFDQSLTSPLRRTQKTLELIIGKSEGHAAAAVAEWLAEVDHGPDEGSTEAAVIARLGEAALSRWDSAGIAPPGWEVDGPSRISAWQAFFAQQAGLPPGNTLLVTSNGAARFALLADKQLRDEAATMRSLRLRTGAWGEIGIASSGTAQLIAWDRRPGEET